MVSKYRILSFRLYPYRHRHPYQRADVNEFDHSDTLFYSRVWKSTTCCCVRRAWSGGIGKYLPYRVGAKGTCGLNLSDCEFKSTELQPVLSTFYQSPSTSLSALGPHLSLLLTLSASDHIFPSHSLVCMVPHLSPPPNLFATPHWGLIFHSQWFCPHVTVDTQLVKI